ncbi:cyclopropane-fatty-acyl-phospholipid synthase [Intrasporangium oryzae NRRL B-24470]|uniref:Cyclopropane-fatty-acyl-phospholipid synthase n=1 Tax=Intrasporangium oryzae NRRL B-24470 TaxID=1386089 RepID=W9G319_9MICO|nr:cyclopropane-fatty-acyl-phospholipid synthase family protein [Intrasporangium oryzae]EWT00400.1 cyclopropane-fatty-acyl-phospholipid synthase [Intrasporangium oryzae NRRL B-24470]
MTVAEELEPIARGALGAAVPIRLEAWDGSALGPPDADLRVRFTSRRALRRLLWAPNELGFARAYVSGDIEIEGDLLDAMTGLGELADPERGPGVQITPGLVAEIARAVVRLRAVGPPPRPPAEEIRLGGPLHSLRRDARAISHHYDVGNEFYRLVLGPSLVYSCAYFEQEASATYGLDEAQHAKLDLVARKLGLEPGMRVLDVGCGWGSFVLHAAREYGVSAVGVTLSQSQAQLARERVAAAGLIDRVEIRVQDYREVDDGPFDAIASIGMAEHVGRTMLPTYTSRLHMLLKPGGRLLNHAISRRPLASDHEPPSRRERKAGRPVDRTSFIDRYVFPDGELEPLSTMVEAIEEAGLEVRDVEAIREHYGRTLRAWVSNLERSWDEAVALSSPGRARVWRLYMAGSALAFEANRIGVNQVLAVRPERAGRSGMPLTRATLLAPAARLGGGSDTQGAIDTALVSPNGSTGAASDDAWTI